MIYHDWVLSGRGVKGTVSSGDEAYDTIVRNSASLRVSAGGYIERTHLLNNTTVSNAGSAVDTFLSGGSMALLKGGIATNVQVLRNARLTVSSGAVATNVTVVSSGNVNATVYGDDNVTLIEGTNERGSFYLSGGTASNFLLLSLGMLTVSSGGTALDTVVKGNGALTVSNGGVATGIELSKGGKLNTTVRGGDAKTLVSGTHDSGTFLLSGGVATDFILYENATQYVSNGGIALHTLVSSTWAHQFVSSGGLASLTSVYNKGSMTIYGGGIARDTVIYSGGSMMAAGGHISGATVMTGGLLQVTTATTGPDESGGSSVLENIFVASGGTLDVTANKAKYSGTVDISGTLKISGGVTINTLTVSSGGSAVVCGTFNVATSTWNTTLYSGGKMTVSSGGKGFGVTVSGGGLLTVSPGGSAADVDQKANGRLTATVRGGDTGTAIFGSNESGTFRLAGGSASGFIVYSGAALTVSNGGIVTDAEVRRGGRINASAGANIGGRLLLDFADLQSLTGLLNDLSRVGSDARIVLAGISAPGTYILADSGSSEAVVHCMPAGVYDNAVAAGGSYTNAFTGRTYDFTTGREVAVTEFDIGEAKAAAGAITVNDTALNGNDRAAKWDADTVYSGNVVIADANLAGDAWLEIDGTDVSEALYGATGNFAHTVNIEANSGTIRNLAAGAAYGGSVAGVKLTLAGADVTGAAYAGGFGTVTGKTATSIEGGTFTKDFYAGALANYKTTGDITSVDTVDLSVTGGTFSGNIYGASGVKAGATATTTVHTAGDVTLELVDGTAANSTFCCFAGGYATGDAAAVTVYTVNDIELEVAGGEWGGAHGGRGVFGGVFASGVTAEAGDVSITINGGTMGNVYGGGWAQKGGTSVGGDVEITINGGTITNVFGGGTHSVTSPGGTTIVDNVKITVAGGSITGAIYAKGNYANDFVNGDTVVTFTGDNDYSCDVFGYSYAGTGDSGLLSFTAYEGTLSGSIGGFDEIELAGDTALTLDTAEGKGVSGNAWTFDVAERGTGLADAAMLEWSGADFSERTVTLNLSEDNATAWALAAGAADYGDFDVQIDGTGILDAPLALGDVIENTGTVCDGWGFTLENDTLKFKQLA
jgi:autotransporter passenger strand-loop-strand repeat protein